jgi:superfamily II DNA or RNA helicase
MTPDYYKKYRAIEKKQSRLFADPFRFLTGVRQATNAIEPCLKCKKAMDIIKKGQKTVVYSAFLTHGVKKIQGMLDDDHIKYVEVTGEMNQTQRKIAVDQYNKGKVNVLFITRAGGEGLDLKETRNVILLEKSWNRPTEEQIIGRAARYQSHVNLPKNEQRVDVYHLLIKKPKKQDKDDKTDSADERLAQLTEEKYINNKMFLELLKSAAVNAPKGTKCPPKGFEIKLSPVKKSPVKKSPVKKLLKHKACNDYTLTALRKIATEQKIKNRSKMNKEDLCKALNLPVVNKNKTCKDYKIAEIKKMATEQKIKNRSKMNKEELCKALKL